MGPPGALVLSQAQAVIAALLTPALLMLQESRLASAQIREELDRLSARSEAP